MLKAHSGKRDFLFFFSLLRSPVLLVTITRDGVRKTNRSACSGVCLQHRKERDRWLNYPSELCTAALALQLLVRALCGADGAAALRGETREVPSRCPESAWGIGRRGWEHRGKMNPSAADGYGSPGLEASPAPCCCSVAAFCWVSSAP